MGFGFHVGRSSGQLEDDLASAGPGWRVRSLAMYGAVDSPQYAAVLWPGPGAEQLIDYELGLLVAPAQVEERRQDGFYPKILTATGDASGWLYTILYEKPSVPPAAIPSITWMAAWADIAGNQKLIQVKDKAGSNLISLDSFWFGQPTYTSQHLGSVAVPKQSGPRPLYYCAIFEESPAVRATWGITHSSLSSGAWKDTATFRNLRRMYTRPEAVIPSVALYPGKPERDVVELIRGDTYEEWPGDMSPDAFTGGVECLGPMSLSSLTSTVGQLLDRGRRPIHVGASGDGSECRFCLLTVKDGLRGPLARKIEIVDALDTAPPLFITSAQHDRAFQRGATWHARSQLPTADDQALEDRAEHLLWGAHPTRTLAMGGGDEPFGSSAPQPTPQAPHDALDGFVRDFMKKRGLRVAHLALAMSGKLVFNRAYTWAERKYPVATPRSLQRIGSVSKALTAIAILQQRSRLADGLNTPLLSALSLPTSPSTDVRMRELTVEHLLRHRSGWGGTNSKTNKLSSGLLESKTGRADPEPGDLREYLRKTPAPPIFVTNPGAAVEYNNWNFVCLSEVVSSLFLTGRFDSYVEQMRQRYFLGLAQIPHVVTGWEKSRDAGDVPCHPRLPGVEGSAYAIDGRFQAGAGFWVMTARDLVRLISRLDPSSSGGPILDDADVPLLWEPYLVDQVGRQSVYDSGNGRGWSYEARRFPGYFPKSGTVLLKNGQVEGGGAIAFHFVPPGGQLSPSITGAFVVNSSRVMTYENVVDPILNIVEALSPTDLSDVDLFSIP